MEENITPKKGTFKFEKVLPKVRQDYTPLAVAGHTHYVTIVPSRCIVLHYKTKPPQEFIAAMRRYDLVNVSQKEGRRLIVGLAVDRKNLALEIAPLEDQTHTFRTRRVEGFMLLDHRKPETVHWSSMRMSLPRGIGGTEERNLPRGTYTPVDGQPGVYRFAEPARAPTVPSAKPDEREDVAPVPTPPQATVGIGASVRWVTRKDSRRRSLQVYGHIRGYKETFNQAPHSYIAQGVVTQIKYSSSGSGDKIATVYVNSERWRVLHPGRTSVGVLYEKLMLDL